MKKSWLLIAMLVGLLSIAAVACDDDEDEDGAVDTPQATEPADETPVEGETPQAGAVDVNLTEWIVSPDPESVAAGSITFTAHNIGGEAHELVIVRTDLAADALPTAVYGSFDEAGEGVEVIDEIEEFDAGGEESVTVDLEAGAYVLLCNVVDGTTSHYDQGMFAPFTVE